MATQQAYILVKAEAASIPLRVPLDEDFSLSLDTLRFYFPGETALRYIDENVNQWTVRNQRAKGKSTGPLSTPNEILIINKSLEKYNQKNIQELSYSYRQLQQQIYNIIKSDILKIVEINQEILIENFILQTLLDEKEKNTQQESSSQSMINPYPIPNISSNNNSISIGFSHLTPPPYPSVNDPSHMPLLPFDSSSEIQQNNNPSQTNFCLEDYRYDSKSTSSEDVDQEIITINNKPPLVNSTCNISSNENN